MPNKLVIFETNQIHVGGALADRQEINKSSFEIFVCILLQRLPITRDLRHSKESDEVAFWCTSIKEKPLKVTRQEIKNFPRQEKVNFISIKSRARSSASKRYFGIKNFNFHST